MDSAEQRDLWSFDWIAQYLAARGYAVLQIGYRGLGGYVVSWDATGTFRGWRQAVSDIADGVRHVVEEEHVPAERICIAGWGSGGYAALISAIEEPSLFQCAVSIAGVTDPGDYAKYFSFLSADKGVNAFIGSGRDVTHGWAPVDRADEVRVPILLFHSRNDLHVPFRHSSSMERALRRRDSPAQLVEYEDGEHGIYPEAYRIDMLTRLGEFVERHTAAGTEG